MQSILCGPKDYLSTKEGRGLKRAGSHYLEWWPRGNREIPRRVNQDKSLWPTLDVRGSARSSSSETGSSGKPANGEVGEIVTVSLCENIVDHVDNVIVGMREWIFWC